MAFSRPRRVWKFSPPLIRPPAANKPDSPDCNKMLPTNKITTTTNAICKIFTTLLYSLFQSLNQRTDRPSYNTLPITELTSESANEKKTRLQNWLRCQPRMVISWITKPGTSQRTRYNRAMFISQLKNPKVSKLMGKNRIFKRGRTVRFKSAMTTPAMIKVKVLTALTCGIK